MRSFRENQWALVALLAALAVVLGYVGFEGLPEGGELSAADSLYRTIQLFVLESGAVPPPVPWPLEVARVLAPLVTVYAAVGAVLTLFRDQLRLLRFRLGAADHVVVAGLGERGLQLARAFRAEGRRVVVLDRDSRNPRAQSCRERGIPVLTGDAADPRLLERARVERARHLAVTCGEDTANVGVALAARIVDRGRPGALTAFVNMDDLDLWRLLGAEEIAHGDRERVRLEFFSVHDAAARVLLEEHPFEDEDYEDHAGAPHLVLVGLEALGERLLLHAAARWRERARAGRGRLRVTVAGTGADRLLEGALARHPALAELCELDARPLDVGRGALAVGASLTPGARPSAAYVTSPDDTDALAAALALRADPALRGAPVVVAVSDGGAGVAAAVREASTPSRPLVPFGVLSRTLTPELLVRGANEALARAKHEQYVRAERAKGAVAADNPSVRPWERLDDSLRESNRRFADGVGPKLEVAGLLLVPDPLADAENAAVLSEEEVEELAHLEHDRWCADLERDGWRPTRGAKDPARKLHPQLVPWAELSEEERDKDREPMRELPRMLALVGFGMHRAAPAAAPPAAPSASAGPTPGEADAPVLRSR